jgi:single-strand DNA-binding protein
MRNLNKITLIGNIGQTPEIKSLADGKKVAKFSLATTEYYKDKFGNPKSDTDWHTLIAWSSMADVIENLCKQGSYVYIEGKLKYRFYDDANNNKVQVAEIVLDKIIVLDKKQGEENL